jgi:hypothetical protein
MRWNPEGLLERAREVGCGDAAHARQAMHWPLFMRGRVHPVFGPEQAAQQLWVLELGDHFTRDSTSCQ